TSSGQIQIVNSAFVLNSATPGSGGGLLSDNGDVDIESTTFSQNSAAMNGGAIYFPPFSSDFVNFSTLSENAAASGGGIYAATSANPNLYHSILANNTAGDCAVAG